MPELLEIAVAISSVKLARRSSTSSGKMPAVCTAAITLPDLVVDDDGHAVAGLCAPLLTAVLPLRRRVVLRMSRSAPVAPFRGSWRSDLAHRARCWHRRETARPRPRPGLSPSRRAHSASVSEPKSSSSCDALSSDHLEDTQWVEAPATNVATRRNAARSSTDQAMSSLAPGLHWAGGTGSMRSNTPGRSLSETMVGRRVVVADDDALLREGIVKSPDRCRPRCRRPGRRCCNAQGCGPRDAAGGSDRRHPDAAHPDLGGARRRP